MFFSFEMAKHNWLENDQANEELPWGLHVFWAIVWLGIVHKGINKANTLASPLPFLPPTLPLNGPSLHGYRAHSARHQHVIQSHRPARLRSP